MGLFKIAVTTAIPRNIHCHRDTSISYPYTQGTPADAAGDKPEEKTEAEPEEKIQAEPDEKTVAEPKEKIQAEPGEKTVAGPKEKAENQNEGKPESRPEDEPTEARHAISNLAKMWR